MSGPKSIAVTICSACLSLFVLTTTQPAQAFPNETTTDKINDAKSPSGQGFGPRQAVRIFRPQKAEEESAELTVRGLRLENAINQRGLDIHLSGQDVASASGKVPTYAKVVVQQCEVSNVRRDATGAKLDQRVDALRIIGGGEMQPIETDVLIEDVYIHNIDGVPVLIQEGKYGTITLRRLRVENAAGGGVQIGVINGGYVRNVVVEDCPGLRVELLGRPGSIGRCVVRHSAGAVVEDQALAGGRRSGAAVETDAPSPASLGQATPAPHLEASLSGEGEKLLLRLVGVKAEDLASVTFEAFDAFDYRQGRPVVLIQGPWQAEIKLNRRGRITCRATITRLGGNPEPGVTTVIEVPERKPVG